MFRLPGVLLTFEESAFKHRVSHRIKVVSCVSSLVCEEEQECEQKGIVKGYFHARRLLMKQDRLQHLMIRLSSSLLQSLLESDSFSVNDDVTETIVCCCHADIFLGSLILLWVSSSRDFKLFLARVMPVTQLLPKQLLTLFLIQSLREQT